MSVARYKTVLIVGLAVAMPTGAVAVRAQTRETFSGMVARLSGPAAGTTGILHITIDNWTTPEQGETFLVALEEGGQTRLLRAMETVEVGFARYPQTLGWRLRYAWSFEMGDTRVVRIATDRPIAFVEARDQFRTMDYPFGIIELRLDKEGKGEGVVYSAASVKFSKDGVLEVESYGTGPQRLLGVTTRR